MKLFPLHLTVFIFVVTSLLAGCSQPETIYGEVVYKPTYAKGFEILKQSDTTILVTKNPWQGAKNIDKNYRFTKPHPSLICMSSSHTAFLDALSLDSVVVGVSGAKFIYNQKHNKKTDIGFDNNLSIETIVALRPSAMTVYEITGAGTSQNDKIEALSVPVIYIADYLEQSPLGRAEWIVAFGALTGQMEKAIEIFNEIETNYNTQKTKNKTTKRIKVMLNTPYRDVWYAAGDSSYIVKLINDAGGEYVVKNTSPGQPISLETAYRLLAETDLWLHPSAQIRSKKQLFQENPKFKQFKIPIFANMRRTTQAGGSDFWESAVVRPDIVLQDLVKIFAQDTTNLYYYNQLQ